MPIPCLPSVPSLLPLLPQWPLLPPPQKARQGLCPLPPGLGLRLWPGLHLWKHPREAFPGPAEHAPRAGRGENGWLMIFSMSLLRLYSEACHGFRSSHLAGPPHCSQLGQEQKLFTCQKHQLSVNGAHLKAANWLTTSTSP